MISAYDWLKSIRTLQEEISNDTAMIWDALVENDYKLALRTAHDLRAQGEGISRLADTIERLTFGEMRISQGKIEQQSKRRRR